MKLKTKLKFYILTFYLIFNIYNIGYSEEPKVFINKIVSNTSNILSGDKNEEDKINQLKKIALDNVDIKGIGLYTLGKHRKNLDESQKEEYANLFEQYFLKSFSSRLVEYTDPKINVLSEDKLNEKYTIVKSVLEATEKRPAVKIDWRVYTKDPKNPKIRDLIIEGLSLARTQKEEFNSVIMTNDGDINSLFITLKKFINS